MFVILTHPRTGSELLADALSNHPDLNVKSEILNPHRYQEWRNRKLLEIGIPILNYTVHIDRAVPVSTIIYDQNQQLADFVHHAMKELHGFKITYDQITPDSPVIKHFRELNKLKFIFLRRSYLESAISHWFAIKTQIWQLDSFSKPIYDAQQVVDPKFVDNFCQFALKHDTIYRNMFREHKHLIVNYRDLVGTETQQDALTNIQEFLELKHSILATSFHKRLSRPLSDVVLNYRELINSPWANLPCLS